MTTVTTAPTQHTSSARTAFHRYCASTLGAIVDAVELFWRLGEMPRPEQYRLRCRDAATAADYGLGEPRPIGVRVEAPDDPLAGTLAALLEITIPEDAKRPLFAAEWEAARAADGGRIGTAGQWRHVPDDSGDFVFSYPVPRVDRPADLGAYLARLMAAMLDEVDLLVDDEVVYPTTLRLHGESFAIPLRGLSQANPLADRLENTRAATRRQPLFSVAQTEPTIPILAHHWALLAPLLRVTSDGEAVQIEGFRLRRTGDWVVPSHGHPSEVYEHLARICNVACTFCYLFGNPETLAIARAKKSIARDELDTRIAYYRPSERTALFSAQWELNEFLVDPRLPEVMRSLREMTDRPFFFTTNGNPLTPQIVEKLAELKPVHFVVSTNTVDEPLRREVMKEKAGRTWTARHCLEELNKHEIPFGVSVVATPDFPLDDLTRTVETVAEFEPSFIRVNEPGFTRDHPFSVEFDTDQLWGSVIEWTQGMRERTAVPLIAIPSAYEENFFYDDPLAARVIGTVLGSPAADLDLRPGDVVVGVGVLRPRTRSEAVGALMLMRGQVELKVRRGEDLLTMMLDTTKPARYPYTGPFIGKYLVPHGVVMAPSISATDAKAIAAQIDRARARETWIVTSALMLPAARAFIAHYLVEYADRIGFVLATNDYLGGNIRVMDMCTVGDIHNAITRHREAVRRVPDLILVPATGFNPHGRDLIGRHWGDLERVWNVPVRLLGHTTQFVF